MNTSKTKNLLGIILVAILSSVITLLGYDYVTNKDGKSFFSNDKTTSSVNIGEFADTFGQDKNVTLTNLTTEDGYPDFTVAAEKSIHGVVHVKTKSVRQQPSFNPFEYFFGFGGEGFDYGQPREQVGFGSGVIISKDGYIITNNHVVDGANEVSVSLNDNREFNAQVVGTDPNTDIALLKIEGDDFSFIPFGNSDELKVGEWVLAVGNPFNLTSTVTAGIVSAKNRGNIVGETGIQSFIQIDAAVNPGNSGGALVNTRGELVGINTAIYSQTGNFTGYAFAIPISTAGKVAADLKEYGSVQRAVLGIQVPNIENLRRQDPERASELSKIQGVVIDEFSERSSSKAAGLEKGDIIKSINNVTIRNFAELQNQLNRFRPGDKVQVTVDRKGSEKKYTVELKNTEGNTEITRNKVVNAMSLLGGKYASLTDEKKSQLGISSGVEITSVTSDGLFRKNGINKGFIIMRVNNVPINSEADLSNIVTATNNRNVDKVILVAGFYPNNKTQYIPIELAPAEKK